MNNELCSIINENSLSITTLVALLGVPSRTAYAWCCGGPNGRNISAAEVERLSLLLFANNVRTPTVMRIVSIANNRSAAAMKGRK